MYTLLNILWFIWAVKYVLFWIYLWQLKEYHFGRFVDHFRTYKGRKLLFSIEQILKFVLLVFLFLNTDLFGFILYVAFLVYFIEGILFAKGILYKSAKKPVITFKTLFLSVTSFVAVILFLSWSSKLANITQLEWLLAFDILIPVIISVIVLVFQPFFVLKRNYTLSKAADKLKKIKSVSGLRLWQ